MKVKINKLAKGIFDKNAPELWLSHSVIEGSMKTGGVIAGSFTITSVNDIEARGIIYADSSRITVKETNFIGKEAIIHYEIQGRGLAAGERLKGSIWIVSDGGELAIPYDIAIEGDYASTSMGNIRNLFHFTNLVKKSYGEAKKLFCSPEFQTVFLTGNPRANTMYESLMKGSQPDIAMEEFLVYVKKKSRITLSLPESRREYVDFTGSLGDKVHIDKDTWGYLELEFETDCDFIRLDRRRITSDAFAGQVYELAYFIDEEKVHGGLNLGRIFIKTPYQALSYTITVKKNTWDRETLVKAVRYRKNMLFLAEQYFDFRMRKISTESWCKRSVKALEQLGGITHGSMFLELLRIQILVTQKKKREAGERLAGLTEEINRMKEEQAALYCYYLYVRVLYTRDMREAKEARLEVQSLCDSKEGDWRSLWVLLYLDEEYAVNKSLRLAKMKEQYKKGARTPFLYYEACAVFNEQPELLRVLNGFELQSVWWGCRHKMLSQKAARQIAELVLLEKRHEPVIYKILAGLYDIWQDRLILESLLSWMLRNGLAGARYFLWYERGIEAGIKLTGLYEAYLNTRPQDYGKPVPRGVAMYFTFDNSLNEKARRVLFRNILDYEPEEAVMAKNYKKSMEQFAVDEVLKGRIDKNLAVIYQKVMTRQMLNTDLAKYYPAILLTRHVICENPDICYIIVRHKEMEGENRIPLVDGEAYFPAFTEDYSLAFEDVKGRRFCRLGNWESRVLFDEEGLIRYCHELYSRNVWIWLHICEREGINRNNGEAGIEIYKKAAAHGSLRPSCRNFLYQRIIEYYMDNYDGEQLEEYLIRLNKEEMAPRERIRVVELLITRSMYEEGYRIIKKYGYEGVSVNKLMRLLIYLLWLNGVEKEERLLELCAYVFQKGKYDETILMYLLRHYYSTTRNMLRLWQAARDFAVDTAEIEERLIVQMMFSGTYASRVIDVFENYYRRNAGELVVRAYLAYQSYLYFGKNMLAPDKIFYFIERELNNREEVQDICKMALLKHYSELERLNETEVRLAFELLEEFVQKNKIFGFFKKFELYGKLPPYIRDKTVLEYRTRSGGRVELHYMLDNGIYTKKLYEIEDMEHLYDGIYSRQFILFYGERLQYYIAEEEGGKTSLTESNEIVVSDWNEKYGESRYHLLNDICACKEMNDRQTLGELAAVYAEKMYMVGECFKPME